MTLDETLLQKLDSWRPAGEGRHTLAFTHPETGTSVRLAVERCDAMSCQLWEITVTRSAATVAADSDLADWAKRVADRVTGLMEPLHLLEIDPEHGVALLRSEKPAQKSEDLFYYEVLLHRTGLASVRRYRGSKQPTQREQVAFVLTHEAAAKLVGDLAADR
jgi:hypothetical protein